jgi:hypothetical protein
MPLFISSKGMFETLFTPTNIHEVTLETQANKNVLGLYYSGSQSQQSFFYYLLLLSTLLVNLQNLLNIISIYNK